MKCRGGEAGEICLSWCMIAPWRDLTQLSCGVILSIPNDGVSNSSTLRRLISQANTFPYCSAWIVPPLFSHKQLSHAAFELSSTINISFPSLAATFLDIWILQLSP